MTWTNQGRWAYLSRLCIPPDQTQRLYTEGVTNSISFSDHARGWRFLALQTFVTHVLHYAAAVCCRYFTDTTEWGSGFPVLSKHLQHGGGSSLCSFLCSQVFCTSSVTSDQRQHRPSSESTDEAGVTLISRTFYSWMFCTFTVTFLPPRRSTINCAYNLDSQDINSAHFLHSVFFSGGDMGKGFYISKAVAVTCVVVGVGAVAAIIALSVVYAQEKSKNESTPPLTATPSTTTPSAPQQPWQNYRLPDSLLSPTTWPCGPGWCQMQKACTSSTDTPQWSLGVWRKQTSSSSTPTSLTSSPLWENMPSWWAWMGPLHLLWTTPGWRFPLSTWWSSSAAPCRPAASMSSSLSLLESCLTTWEDSTGVNTLKMEWESIITFFISVCMFWNVVKLTINGLVKDLNLYIISVC